jgi:hypothetical protein
MGGTTEQALRFHAKRWVFPFCSLTARLQDAVAPKTAASTANDPYWRERAKEARTLAAIVRDQVAKADISRIAKAYEDLAERAAKGEDAESKRAERPFWLVGCRMPAYSSSIVGHVH